MYFTVGSQRIPFGASPQVSFMTMLHTMESVFAMLLLDFFVVFSVSSFVIFHSICIICLKQSLCYASCFLQDVWTELGRPCGIHQKQVQ